MLFVFALGFICWYIMYDLLLSRDIQTYSSLLGFLNTETWRYLKVVITALISLIYVLLNAWCSMGSKHVILLSIVMFALSLFWLVFVRVIHLFSHIIYEIWVGFYSYVICNYVCLLLVSFNEFIEECSEIEWAPSSKKILLLSTIK